jgi:hypothetical protein
MWGILAVSATFVLSPCAIVRCANHCFSSENPKSNHRRVLATFYFRAMFMNKIDVLRTMIWLEELMEATGIRSLTALARQLDPDSFWIDEDLIAKQSKWYCYLRMSHVPSQALSELVQSKVPKAYSELHHPMWRLLRNPDVSERTIRRLRGSMHEEWQYSYVAISKMKDAELRISSALVDILRIDRLTYLDALMAFTIARREAIAIGNHERTDHLSNCLWALPMLYPDDPIWCHDDLEELSICLGLIDDALHLKSIVARDRHGRDLERHRVLFDQQWATGQRMQAKPRALSSRIAARRFYARWLSQIAFE